MIAVQKEGIRAAIHERLQNIYSRRQALRSDLSKSNEYQPSVSTDSLDHTADESNLIDRLQVYACSLGERDQLLEALGRIDRGDFGYCDECEVPIDIRRLRAIPSALLCIDCASNSYGTFAYTIRNPRGAGVTFTGLRGDPNEV